MQQFKFEITHQSKKSSARTGLLHTPHGVVETPAFVPVATRGALRLVDAEESARLGSQLYICNTYHLNLSPGADVVEKNGGLQGYTHLNKPLFTDSGGFQVFSLGFGRDHGMGKILQDKTAGTGKTDRADKAEAAGSTAEQNAQSLRKTIQDGETPHNVKITEDGVSFNSPIDGDKIFLSPEISIEIQDKLGADVAFAFDECPSPLATAGYLRASLDRTHRWALRCIEARDALRREHAAAGRGGRYGFQQSLYGIVQGGSFKDMREESAKVLGSMDFEGFGIGGEFGYDKQSLEDMLRHTTQFLPNEKPRHVLGVGHPEDFEYIARGGGDTFDCIAPTHYARRGVVFTHAGRVDVRRPSALQNFAPLDATCVCPVCTTYTTSFIAHLVRSDELTGMKLVTMHNLFYFNKLAQAVREKIRRDEI